MGLPIHVAAQRVAAVARKAKLPPAERRRRKQRHVLSRVRKRLP